MGARKVCGHCHAVGHNIMGCPQRRPPPAPKRIRMPGQCPECGGPSHGQVACPMSPRTRYPTEQAEREALERLRIARHSVGPIAARAHHGIATPAL